MNPNPTLDELSRLSSEAADPAVSRAYDHAWRLLHAASHKHNLAEIERKHQSQLRRIRKKY